MDSEARRDHRERKQPDPQMDGALQGPGPTGRQGRDRSGSRRKAVRCADARTGAYRLATEACASTAVLRIACTQPREIPPRSRQIVMVEDLQPVPSPQVDSFDHACFFVVLVASFSRLTSRGAPRQRLRSPVGTLPALAEPAPEDPRARRGRDRGTGRTSNATRSPTTPSSWTSFSTEVDRADDSRAEVCGGGWNHRRNDSPRSGCDGASSKTSRRAATREASASCS